MPAAHTFNRSRFGQWVNGSTGRLFKLTAGTAFLAVGLTFRGTAWGMAALAWSALPLSAALFDVCWISAALGGPLRGRDCLAGAPTAGAVRRLEAEHGHLDHLGVDMDRPSPRGATPFRARPPLHCDEGLRRRAPFARASGAWSGRRRRILEVMTPRPAAEPRYAPGSPFRREAAPAIETFASDDLVTHDKYGLGRVLAQEETAVVVDFGSQHVRIASPYRSLTKL